MNPSRPEKKTNMTKSSILIVDDIPANIDVLGNILMETYQVQVALNGPDALEIAASIDPPDLILLDVMMPEMDGFQVLERLKANPSTARIPVIFVTAATDETDEERGLSAGCVDYIHKPVSPVITLARVRTQLELKKHRDMVESRMKSCEREAIRNDAFFRKLFLDAPQGIALMAPCGEVREVNTCFRNLFGFNGCEPDNGTCIREIIPSHIREEFEGQVDTIKQGKRITTETLRVRKDGTPLDVAMHGYPVVIDNRTEGIFLIYEDITHRKQMENRLRHQAFHDELTGIPNRACLLARLARIQKEKGDPGHSVMLVDLDRFKAVNDSLGHPAGDELIRQVAKRFAACVRKGDMVARLGGDEFAVLVGRMGSREELLSIAGRIEQAGASPFEVQGHTVHIGASIGIVENIEGYDRPEDILRDADLAMYRSKDTGKARYTVYDKSLHENALSRLKVETELRKGLENKEFHLLFQPVSRISDGRITGFESLIRWRHPEMGLVPPGKFMETAEETGLIVPMGRWVIEEACEKLALMRGIDPDIKVNINLSADELLAEGLTAHIGDTLGRLMLPPELVVIEITETVLMENSRKATHILQSLKKMGIGIALDDFGTGYSSLSYLHRFPIDTLKIDRSFVNRIEGDGLEIVKTITALAHTLDLRVVAEGVETEAQMACIAGAGCTHVQGYHIARPLEFKAAGKMLAGSVEDPAGSRRAS